MDGRGSDRGVSGYINNLVVLHVEALKEEIEMKLKRKIAKRKAMEGMSFEEKFEFAFRVSYFAMWIAFFAVAAVLHAAGII